MSETEPTNDDKAWYVVYTNPRAEKKLSRLLKKYKIENYLPLISEKRKWSDRFKLVESPCFKSYIFVYIEFWRERVNVLQLPGSHHFVFAKGKPATVDIEILDELRKMLKMRSESVEVRENDALTTGKLVKVIKGPLAGHDLEVEKRKNKVAVFLRFPLMNQVVILEVKIEDISWEDLKL
jgi:transcription antitermination factor NusG